LDVRQIEMPVEDAKKKGAIALFGEKYGDVVRTVFIGEEDNEFSIELCGGTHVTNTSQIGPFFITVETGIASGVRRLEAITGRKAQQRMLERNKIVHGIGRLVNRPEAEALAGVEQLKSDNTALQKEIKKLKAELVSGAGQTVGSETKIGELTLWSHDFGETDRDTLSAWIDNRKQLNQPVVALAVGITNGKPGVILAASADAVKAQSVHAGKLLKKLLSEFGGRGGGKPNFAQGGLPSGVNSQKVIDKLLELFK